MPGVGGDKATADRGVVSRDTRLRCRRREYVADVGSWRMKNVRRKKRRGSESNAGGKVFNATVTKCGC